MRIAENSPECVLLIPECKEDCEQFIRMIMKQQQAVVLDVNRRITGLRIYKSNAPCEVVE